MILKRNFRRTVFVNVDWIQQYVLCVTKRRVLCVRKECARSGPLRNKQAYEPRAQKYFQCLRKDERAVGTSQLLCHLLACLKRFC
jgi:hypothetical protein